MTRIVAIVQARMGSKRFPAKMLARLGDYPLIEWVLRRVQRAETVDEVVLATSTQPPDDALCVVAARLGVAVFRGDENDVLGRFVGAAQQVRADEVVRVCADNPFIDASEIDRLVDYFKCHRCDYACNHLDRLGSHYADGFGAEILSMNLLHRIDAAARAPRHREHVTLYLWDHPNEFRLAAVPAPAELADPTLRFDVDTPEQLARLNQLVELGVTLSAPASQVMSLARGRLYE